jgi:hypothetical protein
VTWFWKSDAPSFWLSKSSKPFWSALVEVATPCSASATRAVATAAFSTATDVPLARSS